jgi:glycosyltransferase involved in cell wall biosynthesis
VIGIFTSPLYRPAELARLGAGRLVRGHRLSGLHLLCSLLPDALFRRQDLENRLRALVVQTETTQRHLQERRLWRGSIEVIQPGVDSVWLSPHDGDAARRALGYANNDIVVTYFGSPAPLRGLPTLLRAFAQARHQEAALKLLVLSRQPAGQISKESRQRQRLLQRLQIDNVTRWLDGCLEPFELACYVAAADIVALPFELAPSDAPLSVLEARALGKPLVTTRVACLPELAAGGEHYLAHPADPLSLAQAILQARAGLRKNAIQTAERGDCGGIPRPWQAMQAQWAQYIQAC